MIKSLFKLSSGYFSGLLVSKFLSLFVFILFARSLLPTNFGQFVFLITLVQVVTYFSDFGLNQWYMRKKGILKRENLFTKVVSVRAATLLISVLLLSLFFLFFPQFDMRLTVIFLYTLIPEALLSIIDGFYLERQEPIKVSLKSTVRAIFLLIGYFFVAESFSTEVALLLYLLSATITAIIFFPWKYAFTYDKIKFGDILNTLKSSSKYAVLVSTSFFYARADHFAVKYLVSDTALGLYNGAYRYLETLALAPTALFQNLFPVSAKGKIESTNLIKIVGIMGVAGTVVAGFTYFLSDFLIIGFLGEEYAAASSILRILSFVLILFFINSPLSAVIQSSKFLNKFLPFGVLNTILNIIFNILFIPIFGLSGAAWAMFLSEVTGLFINVKFIRLLYAKH